MRTALFALFTLLISNLHAQEVCTVTAPSGLSLRAQPSLTAERIGGIPYNAQVESLTPTIYPEPTDTIDNVSGAWVPVRYGTQEGYVFSAYLKYGDLFTPATEKLNNDYRITVPGTRFEALNYDPDLHWYALTTTFPDEEVPQLSLTAVNPVVKVGPALSAEEIDFPYDPGMIHIDANLPDDQQAVLLIGTRQPIDDVTAIEQATFYNCDAPYPLWGRDIYPYQQVPFFQSASGDHYALAGVNEAVASSSDAGIAVQYQLGLTVNDYYRYAERQISQPFTDILYSTEEEHAHGERSFHNHPKLCWKGDLNGDGAPELLFYQPTNYDSCGGEESYYLLESRNTSQGWRWEKVSADTIYYEGC